MEALQRRVLAVPHQILRYFDMVKRSRCSSHQGPYLDTRLFRGWEIENFQTSHVLVVWASVFKHGMMWCSLISHKVLLVRRCGNERITHNETCILACDGLWFGFCSTSYRGWWSSHSHLTIMLRWDETTHQPDLLSYPSIQPFPWVFLQESWWWVMSDESWIWVRCTGGCVCKCDRRPGYFGWQRQPVDPWWQIHGRLWWLWASGQWCFGTLNGP